MKLELTAHQRAFVEEANRNSSEASITGHRPSQEFLDKCNSESDGIPINATVAIATGLANADSVTQEFLGPCGK